MTDGISHLVAGSGFATLGGSALAAGTAFAAGDVALSAALVGFGVPSGLVLVAVAGYRVDGESHESGMEVAP